MSQLLCNIGLIKQNVLCHQLMVVNDNVDCVTRKLYFFDSTSSFKHAQLIVLNREGRKWSGLFHVVAFNN